MKVSGSLWTTHEIFVNAMNCEMLYNLSLISNNLYNIIAYILYNVSRTYIFDELIDNTRQAKGFHFTDGNTEE